MHDKFQNKYRISTTRKSNWDYRWAGSYLITICTRNKEPFFGCIEAGKRYILPADILANVFWYEMQSRNKQVTLGQSTVVPDHIHGILENELILPAGRGADEEGDKAGPVSTVPWG